MLCMTALADTNAALSVSIAVPQNRIGERAVFTSVQGPHFHVMITNTSDQPQRIWQEWCSWGYFALAFELTDQSGQKWIVRKEPREWSKNYPDFWTIESQEQLVLDVEFGKTGLWDGLPPSHGTFTMRAIFEIRPDEFLMKHSVWTGRIVSKADKYVFYK